MSWFKKKEQVNSQDPIAPTFSQNDVQKLMANVQSDMRAKIASAVSGGYDFADTLHNIYLDFGYPQSLQFSNFWNMYRRFGIAQNVVELPVETSWMNPPTIESENPQFNKELEKLIEQVRLFQRLKGLDTRQRVGRYAGMFMRVRDSKKPDQPIDGKLSGLGAIMQMIPLYESQLKVLETDNDPTSERYTMPTMYQLNSSATGSRDEQSGESFSIHPDRIVIAAEGADNGGIYGIPALEAGYNSLMDLRKIIGGGGEGFYKNSAQSIVFGLKDTANAANVKSLLSDFNDNADDFMRNRQRRSLMAPGMDANVLGSELAQPKEFFMNALNDVAASARPMIPATILVGQQTGRLASEEDSRGFLSGINSRNENFTTSMVRDNIDWLIKWGILPAAEYTVEWDDLLALSDSEKLERGEKMSVINEAQFKAGGEKPFTGEEIREMSGFDPMEEEDPGGEDIDDFEGED